MISSHGVVDEHGQTIQFPRTAHQVDLRHPLHQGHAFSLAMQPHDAHDHSSTSFLFLSQLTKTTPHLVLGLLSDRTRVKENDLRLVSRIRELVSKGLEVPHPCSLSSLFI